MLIKSYDDLINRYKTTIRFVAKAKVKAVNLIYRGDNPNEVMTWFLAELKSGNFDFTEFDTLQDALKPILTKQQALDLLGELFPLPTL